MIYIKFFIYLNGWLKYILILMRSVV